MFSKEEFGNIFIQHYDPLCRYLLMYTNDFAVIEDVVQTVFVRLWEEKEKVKIESVKTYLFVAVRNRLFNLLRDDKRRKELLSTFIQNESILSESMDIIDRDTFSELVELHVSQLPQKTQEAYRLSREKNLSNLEIAKLQNVSIKTVNNQLSNANKALLASLKESLQSIDHKTILVLSYFLFYFQ